MSNITEKSWKFSVKSAIVALLLFLIACFVYGWFNDLDFWHAHSNAGFDSSIAHMMFYGAFIGPFVFLVVVFFVKFKHLLFK